eukprot:g3949.t1
MEALDSDDEGLFELCGVLPDDFGSCVDVETAVTPAKRTTPQKPGPPAATAAASQLPTPPLRTHGDDDAGFCAEDAALTESRAEAQRLPTARALRMRIAAARLLLQLCADEDAAHDIGAAGGHRRMLRELSEVDGGGGGGGGETAARAERANTGGGSGDDSGSESDEGEYGGEREDGGGGLSAAELRAALVDALGEAAGRCAAHPRSEFPMAAPPAWGDAGAQARDGAGAEGVSAGAGAGAADRGGGGGGGGGESDFVLLRSVPMRQQAQSTVGFMLWGSARVLSNLLCAAALLPARAAAANTSIGTSTGTGEATPAAALAFAAHVRGLFDSKRVLELGAGVGLCGLVAARLFRCAKVVLTDFEADVLHNLRLNVALSDAAGTAGAKGGDGDGDGNRRVGCVQVEKFDWDALAGGGMGGTGDGGEDPYFDTIIGTDLVCATSHALGVVRSLRALLRPGSGVALLVNPTAHSRWAMREFQDVLRAEPGLSAAVTAVDPAGRSMSGAQKKTVRDYYRDLNLEEGPSSSPEAIREAYLQLAKQWHPDTRDARKADGHDDMFRYITDAYEVLKDPKARALYDREKFGVHTPISTFKPEDIAAATAASDAELRASRERLASLRGSPEWYAGQGQQSAGLGHEAHFQAQAGRGERSEEMRLRRLGGQDNATRKAQRGARMAARAAHKSPTHTPFLLGAGGVFALAYMLSNALSR